MNNAKIFEAARLAEASYGVALSRHDDFEEYVKKLSDFTDGTEDEIEGPFSHTLGPIGLAGTGQSEAQRFADDYKVVNQYVSDVNQFENMPLGLANGFSATLFEDADGNFTLAMRGTEITDLGDLDADFKDIAIDGIALKQATSLFNYYQRLITPETEHALQIVFHEQQSLVDGAINQEFVRYGSLAEVALGEVTLYNYFTIAESSDKTLGIGAIPPGGSFDIVGHSLGGHLAMIMSRLDPERVNEVYSFNGAYFDGNPVFEKFTEWFFEGVSEVQGSNSTVGEFPDEKIETIHALPDVVSRPGTVRPGDLTEIFVEPNNAASAHFISNQSSSLEVYALYEFLFGEVSSHEMLRVLEITHHTNELLENAQNLARVLGAEIVDPTLDESVYRQIEAIVQQVTGGAGVSGGVIQPYQDLQLRVLTESDFDGLIGIDKNSLAFRYALVNGLSFVVTGPDDASLYASHNANSRLDLQTASNPDGLTDSYLDDRVAYMSALLSANADDIELVAEAVDGNGDPAIFVEEFDRQLGETGGLIYFGTDDNNHVTAEDNPATQNSRLYGGGGHDTLTGLSADDYLEGNQGNDSLVGGYGSDVLFGGSGNDVLRGGDLAGDDGSEDILVGGAGSDIYFAGDGDIITDSDGDGLIYFELSNGSKIVLAGGTREAGDPANQWTSGDGAVVYQLAGSDLTVSTAGQSLLIQNVTLDDNDAYLGMQFGDNSVELPEPTNSFVVNTLSPPIWDNSGPYTDHLALYGDYRGYSAFTHPNTGASNETAVAWASYGAYVGDTEPEQIVLGDVQTSGNVGTLTTGVIAGGAGDSVMVGSAGNDLLLDHYQAAYWWDAYSPGQALGAGRGRVEDVNDSDHLSGGAGNDVLMATEGDDTLYGGAGDDILTEWSLHADSDLSAWVAADETHSNRDQMYGGAGNDRLYAHADKNILDGGAGDDQLYAGESDDRLSGGGGNDWLYGDVYRERVSQAGVNTSTGAYVNGSNTNDVTNYGDDVLNGGQGVDYLFGTGGNDDLIGGTGADWLFGDETAGAYTFAADTHGDDHLFGEQGNDNLYGNGGADFMAGGDGDDTLVGDSSSAGSEALAGNYHGNDTLHGGAGNDTLIGDGGDDYLTGGTGADTLIGDDYPQGVAALAEQYQGDDILDGGEGGDVLAGGLGNDTLMGGAGSDTLYGDAFDTTSSADNHGDDTLIGGTGDDYLFGHGGDDHYVYNTGDGVDTVNDSGGDNDSLLFSAADASELTLLNQAGDLHLGSSNAQGGVVIEGYFNSDSIENIELSDGAVLDADAVQNRILYVRGSDGDDVIHGNAQNNIFEGNAGNDTFHGSAGDDEIHGGEGTDTVVYNGISQHYSVETLSDTQGEEVTVVTDNFSGDGVDYLYGVEELVFHDPADNLLPVAGAEYASGIEDEAFSFTPVFSNNNTVTADEASNSFVFGSVSDPDGGTLRLSAFVEDTTDSGDENSTVSIADTGEITITPAQNFHGTLQYTYTVEDNQGGQSTGSFEYEVRNTNDAPEIVGQIDNVQLDVAEAADFTLPFSVFSDADNNIVSVEAAISAFGSQDSSWLVFDEESLSFSGTCPQDGAGNLRVQITATDADGESVVTGFSVQVGEAPRAAPDILIVENGESQVFSVDALLGNDSDPDGYPLSITRMVSEVSGGVTQQGDSFTVTNQGLQYVGEQWAENGLFRFNYAVEDSQGLSGSSIAYVAFVPAGLGSQGGSNADEELTADADISSFIAASGGDDHITGGEKADVLHGNAGDDELLGGGGSDTLRGNHGDDILDGGAGIDTLYGGAGEDQLHAGDGYADVLFGGSGNDQLFGGTGGGRLFGGRGNDVLNAETSSADLYGGLGDDELIGGRGNPQLYGGAGNDTISSSVESSRSTLVGGEGDDTLYGLGADDVAFFAGPEQDYQITYQGDATIVSDLVGSDGSDTLYGVESIRFGQEPVPEQYYGTVDMLYAVAGSDVVIDPSELVSNDRYHYDASDLVLAAVSGAENGTVSLQGDGSVLFVPDQNHSGAAGFSYSLANGQQVNVGLWFDQSNRAPVVSNALQDLAVEAGSPLVFNLGEGVFSDPDGDALAITLSPEVTIDGVVQQGLPDWLTFDAETLSLSGTAPDSASQVVVSFVASDPNGLQVSNSLDITVLGDDTGGQILIGTDGADSLTGGAGGDEIRGLRGRDTLHGGGGNDVIYGNQGRDRLKGGRGADLLYGGNGADKLHGNRGQDQLFGGNGRDKLHGGRGADQLHGENGNDVLYGGRGADDLYGGAGNDRLYGGRGSNLYHFQDGDGNDTIHLNSDMDRLAFDGEVTVDTLSYSRDGDDLSIAYGEDDSITVDNWFVESAHQLVSVSDAHGGTVDAQQINLLVDAVSTFNSDAIESSALKVESTEAEILIAA